MLSMQAENRCLENHENMRSGTAAREGAKLVGLRVSRNVESAMIEARKLIRSESDAYIYLLF